MNITHKRTTKFILLGFALLAFLQGCSISNDVKQGVVQLGFQVLRGPSLVGRAITVLTMRTDNNKLGDSEKSPGCYGDIIQQVETGIVIECSQTGDVEHFYTLASSGEQRILCNGVLPSQHNFKITKYVLTVPSKGEVLGYSTEMTVHCNITEDSYIARRYANAVVTKLIKAIDSKTAAVITDAAP